MDKEIEWTLHRLIVCKFGSPEVLHNKPLLDLFIDFFKGMSKRQGVFYT